MSHWRRSVLFVFGAMVPLHTLRPIPALAWLSPAQLLFPVALVALLGAPATWVPALRRSVSLLAPFALVTLGLLPAALASGARAEALRHLLVLAFVALLFFVGAQASRGGLGRFLARGVVLGVCLDVGLALVSAVAARAAGGELGAHAPRLIGAAENPDVLTAEVAVAFVIALFTDAVPARLRTPILALLGLGLSGAWSHATLAVMVAAFALLALAAQDMRRQVLAALTVSAGLVVYASMRVKLLPLSMESPFVNQASSPFVALHREAARAFAEHPLVGAGLPATFTQSTYLGYAAEAGLLGVLVLLGLMLLALRAARGQRPPFLGVVLFALTAGLTMDVLSCPEILLGLGLLFAKKTDNTLAT
jgi:hypothetical protein